MFIHYSLFRTNVYVLLALSNGAYILSRPYISFEILIRTSARPMVDRRPNQVADIEPRLKPTGGRSPILGATTDAENSLHEAEAAVVKGAATDGAAVIAAAEMTAKEHLRATAATAGTSRATTAARRAT